MPSGSAVATATANHNELKHTTVSEYGWSASHCFFSFASLLSSAIISNPRARWFAADDARVTSSSSIPPRPFRGSAARFRASFQLFELRLTTTFSFFLLTPLLSLLPQGLSARLCIGGYVPGLFNKSKVVSQRCFTELTLAARMLDSVSRGSFPPILPKEHCVK